MQVAVGGIIWNYQEVGKGSRTPLLILHGWGRTGNEWVGMASELSKRSGRKAYVLDLPGFGGSSLIAIKDIQAYTQLVKEFCAYLKLQKVIVLGHSLGGRVGILLAASRPTLVEKLILVDPAGVKPRSLKRVLLRMVAQLFGWVPTGTRRQLATKLMDEDYQNFPALHELYRAVVGEDLRNYLGKITCPVEVIWGEHDPILPLKLVDVYKELLPFPTVRIIWGAGHDPHLSHYLPLKRVLEEAVWTS